MQKNEKETGANKFDGKLKMGRRSFLGLSAATAGVAALSAVPLSHDPVYDEEFPCLAENLVDLAPNGKTVCILGGGLAGMQAGVELAARGFKVTILERSGYPGGKLKTWRDKTFGPENHPLKKEPGFRGVVREHGAHAIWTCYKNLREFMGRYGFKTESIPWHSTDYLFLDKDGAETRIPRFELPPPYDRIQQIMNVFTYGHAQNNREAMALLNGMIKMISFNPHDPEQVRYLDSLPFVEYARKIGIPERLIQTFFNTIAHMVYYGTVDNVSALSMVTAIRMSSGYPRDARTDLYLNPPGETFLEPMAEFIRKHGGQILYNQEVSQLFVQNDRVSRVQTLAVPGTVRVRRCQICGELIYGDENHDHCPFCGADAPQLKDLTLSERQENIFTADYFIFAMDVPGLQKIVSLNSEQLGQHEAFRNILKLTSRPVWIFNYWIPARGFWENRFRSGGDPLYIFMPTSPDVFGLTLNWTLPKIDENGEHTTLIREYAKHDVTILETHLSHIEKVAHLPEDQIARLAFEELKNILPEMPDYVDFYFNRWNNYIGTKVGEHALRPEIQSPLDNLLIIGDLARYPGIEVGMEKTNITAKVAVNILLDKIGQKAGKITLLNPGTPNLFVDLYQKLTTVYPS